MAYSFKVTISADRDSVLRKVESEITGGGGRFNGNTEAGTFSGETLLGHIEGEYRFISGKEMEITIRGKPFILPYHMIESEIRKYFA